MRLRYRISGGETQPSGTRELAGTVRDRRSVHVVAPAPAALSPGYYRRSRATPPVKIAASQRPSAVPKRLGVQPFAGPQITVTTDSDSPDGADTSSISALLLHPGNCILITCISLRDAVDAINNSLGNATVHFALDPRTTYFGGHITLQQGTLNLTQPNISILGPDASGSPITITGPTIDNAATIFISSSGAQVSGLNVQNVTLDSPDAHNDVISGNNIGVDQAGTRLTTPRNPGGVFIQHGANNNTIGGPRTGSGCLAPCNVISGNIGAGVQISDTNSSANVIEGNNIGVDVTGTTPITNELGVLVLGGASANIIGGQRASATGCDGACNVIAGNQGAGVVITGTATTNNIIAGNNIGVNIAATAAISNALSGVVIGSGAAGTTIGGSRVTDGACDGACNVISGNDGNGVEAAASGSGAISNLTVAGNNIGTDLAGTAALSNTSSGIVLDAGVGNASIGGMRAGVACGGPCNLIGGNGQSGVQITGSSAITVAGNYIGVAASGAISVPNGGPDPLSGWSGVAVLGGASETTIGGDRGTTAACAGTCNVIGGNSIGAIIAGSGTVSNTVAGNNIGTNPAALAAIPDGQVGVGIVADAAHNIIGGPRAVGDTACDHACNVIGGNQGYGVYVGQQAGFTGPAAHDNTVEGDYIGATGSGTAALPNGIAGVLVNQGARDNTIGGAGTPVTPTVGLPPPVPPRLAPAPSATPFPVAAAAATARRGGGENIQAREDWFVGQRAYPFAHIPAGARLHALGQLATLRRTLAQRRLPGATTGATTAWQPVGDPSEQTNGSSTDQNGHTLTTDFGLVAGRITALTVDPQSGNAIYAGTADGGVWKGTRAVDGTITWAPTTDGQPSLSIGALAIDPQAPNTIYAATGEGNVAGDSYYGAGILKSIDGGATWSQIGTSLDRFTFSRLVVDPNATSILYAAVGLDGSVNRASTAGGGIYRSTDGGVTWHPALVAGVAPAQACASPGPDDPTPQVPGTDLAVTTSGAATTVYAALGFARGCAANGVYRSTDQGVTWTRLSGFDAAAGTDRIGRIALATTPADPHVLYAAVARTQIGQADDNTLQGAYQSTDGGVTWQALSSPNDVDSAHSNGANQYGYDLYIAADPGVSSTVYLGGIDVFKSADAGATWTNLTNAYA